MANKQISQLNLKASVVATDQFGVDDVSSVSWKVTAAQILTFINTSQGFTGGILAMANGGTNANLTAANGAIPYSTATAFALLAAGASGQLFRSGGAGAPTWTTSTFPATNAVNTLLYASSANVMAALATGNNGVLVTSAGGVPSISSTLPAGLITTDPTTAQGIATKNYVDLFASGITVQGACRLASTVALTVTYNNVSVSPSGVGATLTNAGAMVALTLDGVAAVVADRVLIKDQASALQNGIYTVTAIGSGAANWVLTRATDFDEPSEISPGDLVVINAGNTLTSSSWLQTATVTSVGVSSINWSQFTAALPISLAYGGTGAALTASNGGIFYSNASTGAILAGTATAGLALLSGASTTPSWSTAPPITKVNVQVIPSSATYTPTTGTKFISVQLLGAGGGSGGVTGAGGSSAASGGGGGGGAAVKTYTIALLGATAAVVIGTGGIAGTAGNNTGGAGVASTFTPAGAGVVLTANGGAGGGGMAATATSGNSGAGGAGGTATNGDFNITGGNGGVGTIVLGTAPVFVAAAGGGSGLSPSCVNYGASGGSIAGATYGQGASGYVNFTGSNQAGTAGFAGVCIITEFISV